MKKIINLLLIFFVIGFFVECGYAESEPKQVKVLFIGNSLTSVNNLPKMIADIAESNGNTLIYEMHTPGGARLLDHVRNNKLGPIIRSQKWDFIVIQEQSQFPGFSHYQLTTDVFPYAKGLVAKIKRTHSKAKVVFYMTMARRKGDPANSLISKELLTYEGMQERVNKCYIELAAVNKAVIAPVGEVWKKVRKEKPIINLYSDDVHPNQNGTYLAACVFYTTFFNDSSTGSVIPKSIDKEVGEYLQNVVDDIVLKAKLKWDRFA